MERLALTEEQILRFEEATTETAYRVWTFTLVVGEIRLELSPMAYDRSFNFDNLWQDAHIQGLIDPTFIDTVIYPNRRKLKLEATYDYQRKHGESETKTLRPKTLKFDVRVLDTESKALTNPSVAGVQPLRTQDQTLTLVKFKIVDSDIMAYRDMAISGITHGVTMLDVLKLYLRPGATPVAASRPPVLEERPYIEGRYTGIVGVQITPPDNDTIYPQVILPFDVNLAELPEFLHENYGLYEDGISSCIDRGIVYVFPIMKWSRFDDEVKTLTVINADPTAYSHLEVTHHVDKMGKVEVVSTGEVTHVDNSDWIQLKDGLGKVWIDADKLLDGGIDRNPDDTIFASRSSLMGETSDVERSDELTRKKWSSHAVTSNRYVEESTERFKRTSVLTMIWQHSNHDILYPGMPTMVRTQIGEKMVEIRGTLIGVNTAERKIGEGLKEERFDSTSQLIILIPAIGI